MDADLVALGDDAPLLVRIKERGDRRHEEARLARPRAAGCPGCAARPAALPYWPCDSGRSTRRRRAARWSRDRSRTRAPPRSARRPASAPARSGRPARTCSTMRAPLLVRPLPGLQAAIVLHLVPALIFARELVDECRLAAPRSGRTRAGGMPTPSRPCASNCCFTSGVAERLHHLGMDAIHDLARRAGRQPQAEPVDQVVAREARFLHRRHVGQALPALRAGEREHPHLARLRLLRGDLGADEEEVDAPGRAHRSSPRPRLCTARRRCRRRPSPSSAPPGCGSRCRCPPSRSSACPGSGARRRSAPAPSWTARSAARSAPGRSSAPPASRA